MEHSKTEISKILQDSLEKYSPDCSFSDIWEKHVRKDKYYWGARRVAALPTLILIILIAMFTGAYASYHYTSSQFAKKVDNLDYSFVEDEQILGKWKTVDFVNDIKEFKIEQQSWKGNSFYLLEQAFIKGGTVLTASNVGNIMYMALVVRGRVMVVSVLLEKLI